MTEKPSLRDIVWIVGKGANATVGGGFAGIELIRRALSARGWLDTQGHALLVAVSRLTPGTNLLAYCVGVGWRLGGPAGGIGALLAASLPSSLLIAGVSAALVRVDQYRAVRALLALGALVAAALVLSAAWNLLKPYRGADTRWRMILLSAGALTLLALGVTPVRALLLCAVVGFLLPGNTNDVAPAPAPPPSPTQP
jgi:chromate transporter